jgi:hypothetical protein
MPPCTALRKARRVQPARRTRQPLEARRTANAPLVLQARTAYLPRQQALRSTLASTRVSFRALRAPRVFIIPRPRLRYQTGFASRVVQAPFLQEQRGVHFPLRRYRSARIRRALRVLRAHSTHRPALRQPTEFALLVQRTNPPLHRPTVQPLPRPAGRMRRFARRARSSPHWAHQAPSLSAPHALLVPILELAAHHTTPATSIVRCRQRARTRVLGAPSTTPVGPGRARPLATLMLHAAVPAPLGRTRSQASQRPQLAHCALTAQAHLRDPLHARAAGRM